jgi:hypothetical protein
MARGNYQMSTGKLLNSSGRNSHFSTGSMEHMSIDSGRASFSNIGNKLGMAQTPSGGGGGFNIGGMASMGAGGALGQRYH